MKKPEEIYENLPILRPISQLTSTSTINSKNDKMMISPFGNTNLHTKISSNQVMLFSDGSTYTGGSKSPSEHSYDGNIQQHSVYSSKTTTGGIP